MWGRQRGVLRLARAPARRLLPRPPPLAAKTAGRISSTGQQTRAVGFGGAESRSVTEPRSGLPARLVGVPAPPRPRQPPRGALLPASTCCLCDCCPCGAASGRVVRLKPATVDAPWGRSAPTGGPGAVARSVSLLASVVSPFLFSAARFPRVGAACVCAVSAAHLLPLRPGASAKVHEQPPLSPSEHAAPLPPTTAGGGTVEPVLVLLHRCIYKGACTEP